MASLAEHGVRADHPWVGTTASEGWNESTPNNAAVPVESQTEQKAPKIVGKG